MHKALNYEGEAERKKEMEWKNAILFSIDDTWSSFLRFTTLLTFNSWILSHKTNFVNVEIILENDFTISVANL